MSTMNCTLLMAVTLAVGLPLTAQAPIERVLSAGATLVNAQAVRVAAPKERLPRTATLQATAKMAYAVWQDGPGTTSAGAIWFASTSDGGVSWNAKAIYTATLTGSTSILPINSIKVAASGYSVFVGFLSNQKNPTVTRNDVYVLASSDQGATFSAPTLVNTVTTAAPRGDAQLLDIAAGSYQGVPRCYMVWEHSPVTANEGAYFAAVQVVGTTVVPIVAEVLVNNLALAGANDIDDVVVGCNGGSVCVAWRDDFGNTAGSNDMYAVVSTVGGADIGVTTTPQKVSTNAGIGAIEPPLVAVAGSNCYVYWLDNRNDLVTVNDDAFLAYSNNSGSSWTEVNLVATLPHLLDIDGGSIAAEGNTVVIAFEDDSRARALSTPPSDPNKCDSAAVYVSQNAGASFTATYLSTPPTTANWVRCEQPKVALSGDYVHVCWEESWYNTASISSDEELFMGKSFDGGVTWTTSINVTRFASVARGMAQGGGDIDDPTLCVTGNGEGVVGILHEPLLTSANANYAKVVTRGGLEVSSKFMGSPGLEVRDCAKSQAGKLALVLLTLDPNPVPFYLPTIFGTDGFEPNLVFDAATSVGLQLVPLLSGIVPAAGGAVALPSVPDLSGTVNIVGVTLDVVAFKWLSFSPRGRL